MWNGPTPYQLSKIPKLYLTENVPLKDKLILLHFFIGSCDWFVSEFDGEDLFFGYAILNSDTEMGRVGIHLFHRAKADQDTTQHRGGLRDLRPTA